MQRTPADFRAEIARRQLTLYRLAAVGRIYPGRHGQMLNERIPMTDAVAKKLENALQRRYPDMEGEEAG